MHPVFEKMNQLGRDHVPFLFILDYAMKSPMVIPLSEINPKNIQYTIGQWSNADSSINPSVLKFDFKPPKKSDFEWAFKKIQEEINLGNTYLTNLCFKIPIHVNGTLATIFAQANAKYKLRYQDEFVFFSPETFVKIAQGKISTFPMKGTIDAALPNAKELLLNDPKEDAEHATIVDLLRNDLSRVAKKVRLKHFKYLDLVGNNRGAIWQMSSEIEGVLPKGYESKIGDIFDQLLPAGSITGAPKKKTLNIIQEVENDARGFYTGVAGIFDGQVLDSAVMIRFVEQQQGKYFYRSGGGITSQSELEKEYDELLKKIYLPVKEPLLLETIRLENDVFVNLGWHQSRVDRSVNGVYGLDSQDVDLKGVLQKVIKKYDFGEQVMKCRVIYGRHIRRVEFIPYRQKKIHSLQCVYIDEQPVFYKWEDRSFYDYLLAQKKDAAEILIIKNGLVAEISYANVALYDGQDWWTPAKPLLVGTTLSRLLAEGVLKPKNISVEALGQYQKIRIFNAMIPWSKKLDLEIGAIRK